MVQPSDDFKDRANQVLEAASAGNFFQSNHPRLLPTFDRWNTNKKRKNIILWKLFPSCLIVSTSHLCLSSSFIERQEFTLGATLGKGAYCYVSEITSISLTRAQENENIEDGTASSSPTDQPNPKSETSALHNNDIVLDETDFPVGMFHSTDEMRNYMSEYCLREDDEGKHARYALKQLKPTNDRDKLEQGLIDIAIEAKFLSYISHPNVIKMRGTAGEPLSPDFALVLDRLYLTLHEQMGLWAADKKVATASRWGLCGCSFGTVDALAISKLIFSVITVAYDLSCALRHIHNCK